MRRRLGQTLALGSLLAAWGLASAIWPEQRALPSPAAVARAALEELPRASLWRDVAATLWRVLAGVALAAVLGALSGVALGTRRGLWRAVEPAADFVRAIPPILTFPVFLLGLGYGDGSRVAAIASGTFLIITLHVALALERIPQERRDAAHLLGLRGWRAFRYLHVFELLPALLLGIRLALAAGLIIAVVSEMLVGADAGLGARALSAQVGYRADLLWLVVLLAGAVGALLSAGVARLERRLVHWC